MSQGDALIREETSQHWDAARRRAFWARLRSTLFHADTSLLDFEAISGQLKLRSARYLGRQEIPLAKIVGSVGRYRDFIGAFLPTTAKMEERWRGIAALYLSPNSSGAPPIEVYKVGDSYFVRDGNHRVSVANALEMATIEAYVWEYPIAYAGNISDLDGLLMQAEREEFYRATELHLSHPDLNLTFTQLGGYNEILKQIVSYQCILEQIDGEPHSFEDSAALWHDLLYEPSVHIIEREGILANFPGRTAADLFIWTRRSQALLEDRYGQRIRIEKAAHAVTDPEKRGLFQRIRQWAQSVVARG